MTFPVNGVHLTKEPYEPYECGRTKCRVTLDNLSVRSSGAYKCEVSGDAPAFPLVYEASNMTVIGKYLLQRKSNMINDDSNVNFFLFPFFFFW